MDFLDILDRIDESVTVYDRDARFVFMNGAAIRPFGRPPEELLGQRPWELYPARPPTPFRIALEEVLAGGDKRNCVTYVPHLDRWYEVDIYPHPEGALALARDITEARRAELKLRESEAQFRAMIEHAPEAIVIFDLGGRKLTEANEAAQRLFGRSRDELLRSGPLELSAEKQPGGQSSGEGLERIFQKLEVDGALSFEWLAVAAGGQQVLLEVHARVLPSTSPVLVRTSIFDVTARRRAQEQLAEVQRLEAVARLAGGVAHDFNNVLSVILGCTQLALNELPPTHKVREDLLDVVSAAERAALVTRQLLAFGRKQEAVRRVLDLSAHIERVKPVLGRLVGEDVEIELQLARPLGSVRIDPAHVEQIILNLAANARDAMPDGGRLTILTANVFLDKEYERLHNRVPPGKYVMLSVADTGEGIPDHAKPHVFEPFFTTKALHRGTGLGLATVHGIVQQNGGHIWVYSEPGLGATFKVYLPLVEESVTDTEQESGRSLEQFSGKETILVVEDDDRVRHFVRRALERGGYTVLEAPNAGEALLIFEMHQGPIDLMVTDVIMPRMTGPRLAARLRTVRPDLRVIYLSGYSEDRIETPTSAPHDAFLAKPVAVETLLSTVREVLDRGRG